MLSNDASSDLDLGSTHFDLDTFTLDDRIHTQQYYERCLDLFVVHLGRFFLDHLDLVRLFLIHVNHFYQLCFQFHVCEPQRLDLQPEQYIGHSLRSRVQLLAVEQ